jgi:hypothetical protein
MAISRLSERIERLNFISMAPRLFLLNRLTFHITPSKRMPLENTILCQWVSVITVSNNKTKIISCVVGLAANLKNI